MAEVLALHQQVDGEDDDDAEGSDGAEEAHEEFGGGLELGAVGIDDADRLGLVGVCRALGDTLPALMARSPLMSSTAVKAFSRDCSAGEWTEAIFCWMLRR